MWTFKKGPKWRFFRQHNILTMMCLGKKGFVYNHTEKIDFIAKLPETS